MSRAQPRPARAGRAMPDHVVCLHVQGERASGRSTRGSATGSVASRGARRDVAGASRSPAAFDSIPVPQRGNVIPGSGATRHHPTRYRNSSPYCTSATFHTTDGWRSSCDASGLEPHADEKRVGFVGGRARASRAHFGQRLGDATWRAAPRADRRSRTTHGTRHDPACPGCRTAAPAPILRRLGRRSAARSVARPVGSRRSRADRDPGSDTRHGQNTACSASVVLNPAPPPAGLRYQNWKFHAEPAPTAPGPPFIGGACR